MTFKTKVVFGPPGTGKTTYIVEQIERAIAEGAVGPEILAVSFSRTAANELMSRLEKLNIRKVNSSTIHALCYRAASLTKAELFDQPQADQFNKEGGFKITLKNAAKRMIGDDETDSDDDQLLGLYHLARAKMMPYAQFYEMTTQPVDIDRFVHFCESYDTFKRTNGYIDFSDMLTFFSVRNLGAIYRFSHIFVDEAQDLSMAQWAVIRSLLKSSPTLKEFHVIGDDDQSIFAWNGAEPLEMIRVANDYKASKEVLSQSYRIPRTVHELAMSVVSRISARQSKLFRPRDADGAINFDSDLRAFCNQMRGIPSGRRPSVLALARDRRGLGRLVQDVVACGLPYRYLDATLTSFFDSKAAHAVRAIHRLRDGQPITTWELRCLEQTVRPEWRDRVRDREFHQLIRQHESSTLKLSESQIRYLGACPDIFSTEPWVRVSTVHTAKGREADVVFLLNSLPKQSHSSMALNPDAEHRVWYVAVTRARERLEVIQTGRGYELY